MHRIIANQRGATGIEYAVILLFIVLVIIVAMRLLGDTNRSSFNATADTAAKHMP